MDKIDITIISDLDFNTIHIAVDNGIFQSIENNPIITQLLRIIHNPDKYKVTLQEV